MTIPVEVVDGKLQYNKAWMDRLLSRLSDGYYLLDFISTRKRSQAQNAYYWGVVLDTFSREAAGGSYTKDEWHGLLTCRFLKTTMNVKDRVEETIRSTSKMTTKEFSEYLEQVIWYGREMFELYIPVPQTYGM